MSQPSLWNSYGNQSLNGINYQSPPGCIDLPFDYVLPDPAQFVTGAVVVPAAGSASFRQFLDQGALFLWYGLELPPPAAATLYGYLVTVQILVDNEQIFPDALNNQVAFGNQTAPFPIFPTRWLRPGAVVDVQVTNYDPVNNLSNFALVLRGLKRFQASGGSR